MRIPANALSSAYLALGDAIGWGYRTVIVNATNGDLDVGYYGPAWDELTCGDQPGDHVSYPDGPCSWALLAESLYGEDVYDNEPQLHLALWLDDDGGIRIVVTRPGKPTDHYSYPIGKAAAAVSASTARWREQRAREKAAGIS